MAMSLFGTNRPDPSSRAELVAGQPCAARWASVCGWVPGTGHCRNRPCDEACVFRLQRLAEAYRVSRWRRLRRMFGRR
jgi:hypothetical protein